MSEIDSFHGGEIAIIGISGAFPGAGSVEEYWQLLKEGRSGIKNFSEDELRENVVPEHLLSNNDYVRAKGVLPSAMEFDPGFFGYSEREAAIMDPQLRLFQEFSWKALEDSGYATKKNQGIQIGVFGGASANTLWTAQFSDVANEGGAAAYEVINLISRDFYASRVAYAFDLKGPAVTIQTACSTGLVAVHSACQSLLSGDSDIAIAGAVSLSTNPVLIKPDWQGYLYQEGMILSPDGVCRPFDENSAGTVLSDGVGFVVIRRLQDAIAAGDRIYAVIKGSAVNNDGNEKVGYTAPSVTGQKQVIKTALELAGVSANDVQYVEAHGTGTNLGDPIEMQSLREVYGQEQTCWIGSVKGNIGHTDTAAGMAGLIKTVLAIKEGMIPQSVNFTRLNPKCDFTGTNLKVAESCIHWPYKAGRFAAVSSFGIGGTNSHVILESYQHNTKRDPYISCKYHLLPISGTTPATIKQFVDSLRPVVKSVPNIGDVVFTLAEKRARHACLGAMVIDSSREVIAVEIGSGSKKQRCFFMFSGQGAQYPQMARKLFENNAEFRRGALICCDEIVRQNGPDIQTLLWGDSSQVANQDMLRKTNLTQLALFVVEYALAKSLISHGIQPSGLIGHSLGEYVAACLAGVFSLSDAVYLIMERCRLVEKTQKGKMFAVHCSIHELAEERYQGLWVAARNTQDSFVLSGAESIAIGRMEELIAAGIHCTELNTAHAFHSGLLDPILDDFRQSLVRVNLRTPSIPIISNVTGDWANNHHICSVDYWVEHLRSTVLFENGAQLLSEQNDAVLIEIGPGHVLSSFVKRIKETGTDEAILTSLPSVREDACAELYFVTLLARLTALGCEPCWQQFYPEDARLCSLPFSAMDKKTYLYRHQKVNASGPVSANGKYHMKWNQIDSKLLLKYGSPQSHKVLYFHNGSPDEILLSESLIKQGDKVISVKSGQYFSVLDDECYQLSASQPEDFRKLIEDLIRKDLMPARVIFSWQSDLATNMFQVFDAMVLLTQAFSNAAYQEHIRIIVISEGAYRIAGDEQLNPAAALSFGPIRVISQEYDNIDCHQIDLRTSGLMSSVDIIAALLRNEQLPLQVGLRGKWLWLPEFERVKPEIFPVDVKSKIRKGGVYLITGASGGLGVVLSCYLAKEYDANLILVSRNGAKGQELVEEVKALGGAAVSLVADISKDTCVELLHDTAIERFGRLDGIFHLAGVPGEVSIQRTELKNAHHVIETKLGALVALVQLKQHQNLDFLLLFSSTTGVLGGIGQVDYCSANAVLSAVAEWADSVGIDGVQSIQWDAWQETGMAVSALNNRIQPQKRNVHNLLGDLLEKSHSHIVFRNSIVAEKFWPLSEHIVMGTPTVPGATYLEMVSAAIRSDSEKAQYEISGVYFLTPLAIKFGQPVDLYTYLLRTDKGYEFEISSYQASNETYLIHAHGTVQFSLGARPPSIDLDSEFIIEGRRCFADVGGAARLGELAAGIVLPESERDALMKYGTRWDCFDTVCASEHMGIAKIKLPVVLQSDLEEMQFHPALLDCATSFLRVFVDGGVYIPISYGRLKFFSPIQSVVYSVANLVGKANKVDGVLNFNIHIYDEKGACLFQILDFSMRRIDSSFASAPQSAKPSLPAFIQTVRKLSRGIKNGEAMQVIEQILSDGKPVTTYAVDTFLERLENADSGETGVFSAEDIIGINKRARPDIATEFVNPKTEKQKQIAKIWEDMLGLESVGINDDFFELGGDSLLLMQIHKKVNQLLESAIPVVELYNYPTILKLTDFIASSTGDSQDAALDAVSERVDKKKAALARRKQHR